MSCAYAFSTYDTNLINEQNVYTRHASHTQVWLSYQSMKWTK